MTFSDAASDVLEEARLRAAAVVDAMHEGVVLLDASWRIVTANPAFCEMFGTEPAAIHNMSLFAIDQGALDVAALRAALADVIPSGNPSEELDIRLVLPRIGERVMRARASRLGMETGRPYLILLIIEDITERKRAEDADRDHRAELARVLRVNFLGELGVSLAHEVSQPLAAVVNTLEGCATNIRSGKGMPKELLDLIDQAIKESLRAVEIVRHLRDLVRGSSSQREDVDLRRLIENAVLLITGQLRRNHIVVQLALGDDPLPVHVTSF